MTRPSGWKLGIRFLLTWKLHQIFFELWEEHFWNEDSEINGIPEYVATLHKSDFVNQNAANHKITNYIYIDHLELNNDLILVISIYTHTHYIYIEYIIILYNERILSPMWLFNLNRVHHMITYVSCILLLTKSWTYTCIFPPIKRVLLYR
jgi:hypothetical protein